jgi:hypothetical protein
MADNEKTYTPVVAASGIAVATIKVANGLSTWTVTQVSIAMPTAPAGATCQLQKNSFPVTPMVATGDTAGGDPPVMLRPSDVLTVTWTGCTPGTAAQVLVFFDDGEG